MTTRTKLNLASYTASTMLLLNIFSRPLGITDGLQWSLLIGMCIPLGMTFVYISKLKEEKARQIASGVLSASKVASEQSRAKQTLVVLWICMVPFTLSFPFWLPAISGVSLGRGGDYLVSVTSLIMVSVIFWLRLRKMPNQLLRPTEQAKSSGGELGGER